MCGLVTDLDLSDIAVFIDELGDKCVEIAGHTYDIGSEVMDCGYVSAGTFPLPQTVYIVEGCFTVGVLILEQRY